MCVAKLCREILSLATGSAQCVSTQRKSGLLLKDDRLTGRKYAGCSSSL
jgi:hypothetical protein